MLLPNYHLFIGLTEPYWEALPNVVVNQSNNLNLHPHSTARNVCSALYQLCVLAGTSAAAAFLTHCDATIGLSHVTSTGPTNNLTYSHAE